MDEEIAVIGSAAVGRCSIEGIIGLTGARETIVPVALRDFDGRFTLGDATDVNNYQVWNGWISVQGWSGDEQEGAVFVLWIHPQKHLMRLYSQARFGSGHEVGDELRVGGILQAEKL